MAEADPPDAPSKGERTKQRILDRALELFREHGYDATTMRMVADAAEVSLGNAYYYFASKDLLLQAFYREVHEAHIAATTPRLAKARTLRDRLLAAMLAKLDVIEPYHQFSALMFRTAADPESPLVLAPRVPAPGDAGRHRSRRGAGRVWCARSARESVGCWRRYTTRRRSRGCSARWGCRRRCRSRRDAGRRQQGTGSTTPARAPRSDGGRGAVTEGRSRRRTVCSSGGKQAETGLERASTTVWTGACAGGRMAGQGSGWSGTAA
jgi:AcrR family transcriptional regulator